MKDKKKPMDGTSLFQVLTAQRYQIAPNPTIFRRTRTFKMLHMSLAAWKHRGRCRANPPQKNHLTQTFAGCIERPTTYILHRNGISKNTFSSMLQLSVTFSFMMHDPLLFSRFDATSLAAWKKLTNPNNFFSLNSDFFAIVSSHSKVFWNSYHLHCFCTGSQ